MKGKSILKIKPWPKINHPLPQTPRESQQLLSALTSSFRRQLDAADTHQPVHSANEHMQTILSNPLFRVVPPKPTYPQLASDTKSRLEKRIAEEPMIVFDELVAAGSITGKNIGDCLQAQLILIGSRSVDVTHEMKQTGAGMKIMNWFWASDPASRTHLFRSRRTWSAALKFMTAEGLHSKIAVLQRMLSELRLGGDSGQIPEDAGRRIFSVFLQDYIAADIQYGRGIGGALATFTNSVEMVSSMSDDTRNVMLTKSAEYLGRLIVDYGRSNRLDTVPVPAFERFCDMLKTVPWTALGSPALQLYHPSHPTATPFMDYIRDHPELPQNSPAERNQEYILRVHLDAMRLLLDQNNHIDALRLAPRIKEMLSEDRVEIHKSHNVHSQISKLMDRLDLAIA
ncbi:hypothetical protein BGW36DRAFT_299379 [Talaromyces proteolyticus]|uniref:Uncharacterized protein n=1 Tax=Talaromyces proteolyticus TaxID=1131652 RepID=A0AAD4KKP8_9EURO|nr:uncharacterized protein BGW36DRAFT_299379 [Talaromyces proteolyticus]KAH8694939.1 hypothetical protein BGW36DRAFT_299379 [Talaromyces proteolyticus]